MVRTTTVALAAALVVIGGGCDDAPSRKTDARAGDAAVDAAPGRDAEAGAPSADRGAGDGQASPDGPSPDGPAADGPSPDGPSPDGPAADGAPPATMKSAVTQYGITWTFDKAYPCGQFVTGDWWIVGPVTVVSVSPQPTGSRNGSMLDPVGEQAYDARGGEYNASKAVSFPITLTATSSLVSSISHPDTSECSQGGSPGWYTYDGDCQRGPIATQAVLTAVPGPQPADAFRPPYAGPAKPLHRASGACWSLLPKLPVPGSAPAAADVLRDVERPWIDHLNSWTMQHGCATLNMYCYGREIGNIVSKVALFALLDTPQQQAVATRLIQLGIDNFGVIEAGGGWGANGGHFNGRKWPIVFAGVMLDVGAMKSPGNDIGNEDQQVYVGTNGTALWGADCNSCYFASGCSYSGSCTAGAKDCRDPAGLVDGCEDYRNCCTSLTWVGEALAAWILGVTGDWGHQAFFDYVDRWMTGDVQGGGGTGSTFVSAMWATYRNNLPAPGSCP